MQGSDYLTMYVMGIRKTRCKSRFPITLSLSTVVLVYDTISPLMVTIYMKPTSLCLLIRCHRKAMDFIYGYQRKVD